MQSKSTGLLPVLYSWNKWWCLEDYTSRLRVSHQILGNEIKHAVSLIYSMALCNKFMVVTENNMARPLDAFVICWIRQLPAQSRHENVYVTHKPALSSLSPYHMLLQAFVMSLKEIYVENTKFDVYMLFCMWWTNKQAADDDKKV
jgi:hypothetical protein